MRIALFYDKEITESLEKVSFSLVSLGHHIVQIDISKENHAIALILQNNIKYIFVCKFYTKQVLQKSYQFSHLLDISIINLVWCYENFSKLLNSRKCRNTRIFKEYGYGNLDSNFV